MACSTWGNAERVCAAIVMIGPMVPASSVYCSAEMPVLTLTLPNVWTPLALQTDSDRRPVPPRSSTHATVPGGMVVDVGVLISRVVSDPGEPPGHVTRFVLLEPPYTRSRLLPETVTS